MKCKKGVRVFGVSNEILFALVIVESIFHAYEINPVVTSMRDSLHSKRSKHYSGNAVDIRMKYISDTSKQVIITNEIREALTSEFDVLLENVGTESVHLHVEFDPTLNDLQSTI